ncbi:hypothetical protein H4S07_006012, partial [Coemansia furcata]
CLPSEDALQYVEESAPGGAIDEQLAEAERHIDRAVSDLEVALDAFHVDAHRAAQEHAHASESCARVAANLGFAFMQRRAHAQVVVAGCGIGRVASCDDAVATATAEERDCTRDLLRTLAAVLARS